jgi:CheY-like chemotaxis protein
MTDSIPPRSLCLLVVDDCADTTATLAVLGRRWGHLVRVANNGTEALRLAVEQTPDVILLDIGMPGMDGWELTRRLRRLPSGQTTRIVAVSGYGQREDQIHSREVGCDLHLLKPVEPELLRRLLATWANERSVSAG